MVEHGAIGKSQLALDADALRLGLHAVELDAVVERVNLDPVEHAEEIEMPPRAAELSVGRELETGLLLFFDDLPDLAILDLLELGPADLTPLALRACFLQ